MVPATGVESARPAATTSRTDWARLPRPRCLKSPILQSCSLFNTTGSLQSRTPQPVFSDSTCRLLVRPSQSTVGARTLPHRRSPSLGDCCNARSLKCRIFVFLFSVFTDRLRWA